MTIYFSSDYVISIVQIIIMYLPFFYILINDDPWKTWVKISKVMPLPKSIPPGKGGKPYGKKSKSFGYKCDTA